MQQIARFYTIFLIAYFYVGLAYNEMTMLTYSDEVLTIILIAYTFMKKHDPSTNKLPWNEYNFFLVLLAFYVAYGLIFGRNVKEAVFLDFIQEIRPYSFIYCTWILNPRFTDKQKKWIVRLMVMALGLWIAYHPQQIERLGEIPILGQMAMCAGMTYYLFSERTRRDIIIATAIAGAGLLAPKMKYMGEFVAMVAFMFYVRKKINFRSPSMIMGMIVMVVVMVAMTWTKFEVYFVDGWENENLARPMTYKTAWKILWDYFPFGSGMGSFACNGAWKYYSPLYHEYNLDIVWGLGYNGYDDRAGMFICDAFYPTLAQFGFVGIYFFIIFWKRRISYFTNIYDLNYYKIALLCLICLAIEQTSDSSFLSGRGMVYCMLIGFCMNANLNEEEEEEDDEEDNDEEDDDEEEEDEEDNTEIKESTQVA